MTINFNTILIMVVLSVIGFFSLADKVDTYLFGSDVEVYFLLISTLFILFVNRQLKNVILEFLSTFFVFFYIAVLLIIKFLISLFKSTYTFNTVLFRLFIMMSFYLWLRGPGLDMVFLFTIYKGIFVLFMISIVKYNNLNTTNTINNA